MLGRPAVTPNTVGPVANEVEKVISRGTGIRYPVAAPRVGPTRASKSGRVNEAAAPPRKPAAETRAKPPISLP